ncbi:MAG: hypothetical protein GKR93_02465 [Gammaproteobacteria bacterium]|nr:hypothetical protein [Gammaproteobacteria bacterium]
MNKERLIWLFISLTAPLLVINAVLKHFFTNFLIDNFGSAAAKTWTYLLSLVIIMWCLLVVFILISFVYLIVEERLLKKKQEVMINDENEIILSREQKENLIQRVVLDISLVFNSRHRGIEHFDEDNDNIKFAVLSADDKEAEIELEEYMTKFLGRQVLIEPGQNERTRRWDRLVTLL